jgi:UDP-N-acetylmuramoyl-L-alanyl-D-glutamate--2,6-diaminopimelate ligase
MPATATNVPRDARPGRAREPVSLRRLFPSASFVGCADIRATQVTERADECGPGVLFAARPGSRHDGAAFAAEAVERGAAALLVMRPIPELQVPQCVLGEVGRGFGLLCANLAGRPMRTVRTAGVTGTNGKTTVTWLIRSLLESAGDRCGLLGTIEYSDGARQQPASLTTPDSKTFWDWFAAMAARGTRFAAVELSSHALHQDRVAGSELELAIVTNVSHDHLDYHGTSAGYLASKAKILSLVRAGGTVILNQDDPCVDVLRPRVPAGVDVMTFALRRRAAVSTTQIRQTPQGSRFRLSIRGRQVEVQTPLLGRHNVANCLAAAAAADRFGLSAEQIAHGLSTATSPPGRMERVGSGEPFQVLVDYAHTPDALEKAIAAARAVATGKVIVVFGAGGDRDRSKRPLLGNAAASANIAVITSDNPRSEDPVRIIEEIHVGLAGGRCESYVEPDRATAISLAIAAAETGDVVLICGKGHESVQVVGDRIVPLDDRDVAAAALAKHLGPQPREKVAA